jgi:hypothetical protein
MRIRKGMGKKGELKVYFLIWMVAGLIWSFLMLYDSVLGLPEILEKVNLFFGVFIVISGLIVSVVYRRSGE